MTANKQIVHAQVREQYLSFRTTFGSSFCKTWLLKNGCVLSNRVVLALQHIKSMRFSTYVELSHNFATPERSNKLVTTTSKTDESHRSIAPAVHVFNTNKNIMLERVSLSCSHDRWMFLHPQQQNNVTDKFYSFGKEKKNNLQR